MQGQRLPRLPPARRQGTSRWPEVLAAPTAALLLVAVLLTEALPKEVAFRGRLVPGVTGSVWSAVGERTRLPLTGGRGPVGWSRYMA